MSLFDSISKIFKSNSIRFLVVDDNIQLDEFLVEYLKRFGHEAYYLSDGAKTCEWIKSNGCDAVILDLNLGLPNVDGINILSQIRNEFPNIPVVIFTGDGYDEERLQAAIRAGASGYVSKSVRPSDMYSALMRSLKLQQ